MRTLTLAIALVGLTVSGFSQTPSKTPPAQQTGPIFVKVTSKGHDVREALTQIFTQAGKSFVLQQNLGKPLYLSLDKIEFEKALDIVCKEANLEVEIKDDVYYVQKVVTKHKAPAPKAITPVVKPAGTLPKTVLNKRVTTRLKKTDLRTVFAEFEKQTGVKIEVEKSVPNFKLDAYLISTSLKYALDRITDATGLEYKFTDHLTIQVSKIEQHVMLLNN